MLVIVSNVLSTFVLSTPATKGTVHNNLLASNPSRFVKKMFRFLFLTLFPVVSGISDKCLLELDAIYESGDLENGLSASVTDFAQNLNADGACTPNGSTYSCVYDYSTVAFAVEPLCKEVRASCARVSFRF